jgi:segregation and condensation protein A
METPYSIKLPFTVEGEQSPFEGPLDLLLHLIRENKVDIYDIPIAVITRQYLDYIELMKELNLEIAGEFIVMAATLIHIKSRMLLPVEETLDTEEAEDPRLELVQRLLEYQAFKEAALGLKEMEDDFSGVFRRSPDEEESGESDGPELYLFDASIFDLIGAFKKVLERAPAEIASITKEALTVKDKISLIIDALQEKEALRFEDLFKADATKVHLIVTFVALLEILRLGLAKTYQEREFGAIWIIKTAEEGA